jgi:hypothetical protein
VTHKQNHRNSRPEDANDQLVDEYLPETGLTSTWILDEERTIIRSPLAMGAAIFSWVARSETVSGALAEATAYLAAKRTTSL